MDYFKVSIIVPVYNAAEYIRRCLDSLTNQTYREIEIVLVDDGSTDESGRLCEEYARKDSRIRTVHQENGGLISAWKRGVKESCGEYLCFVDVDDWIELNMIGNLVSYASGKGKEMIACDYLIERPGGAEAVYQTLEPGIYEGQDMKSKVFPVLLGNEKRAVCLSRCMKLIARGLIEENSKYSQEAIRMGEDVTVMLPSLLDCERLVIVEQAAWYHYYYNQTSMVHQYDSGLYDNMKQLRASIDTILKEKGLTGLKKQADREYLFLLMLTIKNEARGNPKGYAQRISVICRENKAFIQETPVKISEKSGKLIYTVMKHPSAVFIGMLRLAMILFYNRNSHGNN